MEINVTYYTHSGFSVAVGGALLVFDYWLGEEKGDLPESLRITPELLKQYDAVYVFISHSHPDHFDPVVLTWGDAAPVHYILGEDLPADIRGDRMSPGDILRPDSRMLVTACASTDLGVSFHVAIDGFNIFHAGDLNFWHWREESTVAEIEEADADFHRACETLNGLPMDLAFFPVDPRQSRLFDAGVNYFTMTAKPRLLIPMHFWKMREVINEYARRSRSAQTEIIPMTIPGEQLLLDVADDGFMTIELAPAPESARPDILSAGGEVDIGGYEGSDPFFNTDEPVDF